MRRWRGEMLETSSSREVRALEEMVLTDSTAKQLMYCQHLLGSYCMGSAFRERQAGKSGLSREIFPNVSHCHSQQ